MTETSPAGSMCPAARPRFAVGANPFRKPDFVMTDAEGREEFLVRRRSFIPARFRILEHGRVIGEVRMLTVFRIRYSIEIDGSPPWIFRMPLYTVNFYGTSPSGPGIWVSVGPSKMDWRILLKPGLHEGALIAALAFIHNEWWNYS